MSIEI